MAGKPEHGGITYKLIGEERRTINSIPEANWKSPGQMSSKGPTLVKSVNHKAESQAVSHLLYSEHFFLVMEQIKEL